MRCLTRPRSEKLDRAGVVAMASACAALVMVLEIGPAAAQESREFGGFLHNLRGGVVAHDVGAFSSSTEEGAAINVEIQFSEPGWAGWQYILSPRPIVGTNINTIGDTSRGYAGLYWDYYPMDWLFVGGTVGATVHNGELDEDDRDRRALGSRVLFHLALEIGVRFAENHGLSIYADHASNANLADENEGIESAGVRYTYFFGGR